MTVIVTGASKGLGFAIAKHLLTRKAPEKVIAIARNTSPLDGLQAQFPNSLTCIAGDICDSATSDAALKAAKGYGGLNSVIYNAGVLEPVTKVCDAQTKDWRTLFEVNLFSIITSLQIVLPELRASKGRIVMVSSGASVSSYQGWSAYGCSKAAVNHLAQDLGAEEPDIITIAVRPGVVDTDMQRNIREQHGSVMSQENHKKFTDLKQSGGLNDPAVVGKVIGEMALGVEESMSGKFVEWTAFRERYS